MSQSSPTVPYQTPTVLRPQTNVPGLIGFILVMVGLIGFCVAPAFFLGFVGTVLCGIAVFKRPRGLAIAGLAVGFIELLVVAVMFLVLGVILTSGLSTAAQQAKVRIGIDHAMSLSSAIDQFKRDHDRLPTTLSELPVVGATDDGFGNPIRYQPNPAIGTYRLLGNGWDGQPDTKDDFVLKDTSITPYSTMQIPSMPPARKPASVPAFPKEPDDPK